MELCWFYKPLYVLMEEVPDVVGVVQELNSSVGPLILKVALVSQIVKHATINIGFKRAF